MKKTITVDTCNLYETTDDFTGTYKVDGIQYDAEGIETGYIIMDKVADRFGLDQEDDAFHDLQDLAGCLGRGVCEIIFDDETNEVEQKYISSLDDYDDEDDGYDEDEDDYEDEEDPDEDEDGDIYYHNDEEEYDEDGDE